jgi:hypothetical protein
MTHLKVSADTTQLHILTHKDMAFSDIRYGRSIMLISKFSKSFVIFTFQYANMKRGFLIVAACSEVFLWGISVGSADCNFSSAREFEILFRIGYADPPRQLQWFFLWPHI